LLLKNGAEINAQNDDMDTPMHLALRAVRIEIVYMLLRNGGNPKIEGFLRKDCIQTAKDTRLFDLAETLKNYNFFLGLHPFSSPILKAYNN
jgi:ankyrin repeat protein